MGAATLEEVISTLGAQLVRLAKYRTGPSDDRLRRDVLDLGGRARRLHRHGMLDGPATHAVLTEAHGLTARLEARLAAIRTAPEYRAAVAAHARGDRSTLSRLLPAIFAGLEVVEAPAALHHPIAWRRRGRLRGSEDLVEEILRLRDDGLAAEGTDDAPGADPALPAVTLYDVPPPDEPIAASWSAVDVGATLRLRDTGEHLAHVPTLHAPVRIVIAAAIDPDLADVSRADWGRIATALRDVLGTHAIPVEDAPLRPEGGGEGT